jgi:hypothetical protein
MKSKAKGKTEMPKSKLHRDQTKTNAVSEPPCEPNPVERWGIHSEEKKTRLRRART